MERSLPKLRFAALLAAGSLLVHELRYAAGYGGGADEALARHGHGYLPWLEALAGVLLLLAVARFAGALARASRGHARERCPPGFRALWAKSSLALAAVYSFQEGFEGTLAPGHPDGTIGVLGHGGWTAVLLAVLVGAVVAALAKLAHCAVRLAASRPVLLSSGDTALRAVFLAAPLAGRRLDVLAYNLAGRAPPRS